MSETFKEGDVVQLKSGGPLMTVTEVNQNGYVTCQWFKDADPKDSIFKTMALKDRNDTLR